MTGTQLDDFLILLKRMLEVLEPIVERAVEHNMVSPVEQAEFLTVHEALCDWYLRVTGMTV